MVFLVEIIDFQLNVNLCHSVQSFISQSNRCNFDILFIVIIIIIIIYLFIYIFLLLVIFLAV